VDLVPRSVARLQDGVAGMAHPERVPNARVRSFADELANVVP